MVEVGRHAYLWPVAATARSTAPVFAVGRHTDGATLDRQYAGLERRGHSQRIVHVSGIQTGLPELKAHIVVQCAVENGRLLGAEKFLLGSLSRVGTKYLVNLRLLDVETGVTDKSVSLDRAGETSILIPLVRTAARTLIKSSTQ